MLRSRLRTHRSTSAQTAASNSIDTTCGRGPRNGRQATIAITTRNTARETRTLSPRNVPSIKTAAAAKQIAKSNEGPDTQNVRCAEYKTIPTSHSWTTHGWPAAVNENGSEVGNWCCWVMYRPTARCHQ